MRRLLVLISSAALCLSPTLSSTAALAGTGGSASIAAAAAPAPVRTKFAMVASAYGTRVQGGELPVGSDDTAYERIACTNLAGLSKVNFVADQTIPGLGKAEGVRTRVWTERTGDTISSFALHSIAKLTIGDPSRGAIEITGIRSLSQAFNRNGRFGTKSENEIARITLQQAGQPAQVLAIPAPGRTLTIPGLLELSLGKTNRKVTTSAASVSADVIDLKLLFSGTRARVAQTKAVIQGGIRQGIFRGFAAGLEGRALADNTKVGRIPLSIVPCRGNTEEFKNVTGVALGDLGSASGVAAAHRTSNRPRVAQGTAAGRVAEVSLFDGRVVVKGILGVANVKRERGVLTRNTEGSTVLDVVIDGETYSFPAIGKIRIPGLVELDDRVVTRTSNGLKVVGLRVTALDGSGAVIDLAVGEIAIRPGVPAGR